MKNARLIVLSVLLSVMGLGLPAMPRAQEPAESPSGATPLEISADGTLEWLKDQKKMVARGNALAKQGDSSISAQTLTADYREGAQGKGMDIWQVTAEQDVVLTSKDSTAYGDHAVYGLDEGKAVMTGQNLKIVSPEQTVTAKDQFEYWVKDGRFNALGTAKVVRPKPEGGTDTLQADKISAVLKDMPQGGHKKFYSIEPRSF